MSHADADGRTRVVRAGALHAAGVGAIYGAAVRTSNATFDLAVPDSEHWLAKIGSAVAGDHFLVVLDGADQVAGFAYAGSFRPRPGYAGTKESSIYLRADTRGAGVGLRLYSSLLDAVRRSGMHTVLAAVAEPNPASAALHARLGFRRVGTMREVGFKFGGWIDTTWYQLML